MFACGWYEIKWYNEEGEMVKHEEKYLNDTLYRHEVMKMQTAFLYGENVVRLVATPLEKK